MKSYKQFQEGLGKIKLLDIAKAGVGAYALKKGAEFLGRKKGESDIKNTQSKSKYKKYENPGDGSIPGRYKDETIMDYKKRRYDGIEKQIDKM